eukprot:gene24342-9958_t
MRTPKGIFLYTSLLLMRQCSFSVAIRVPAKTAPPLPRFLRLAARSLTVNPAQLPSLSSSLFHPAAHSTSSLPPPAHVMSPCMPGESCSGFPKVETPDPFPGFPDPMTPTSRPSSPVLVPSCPVASEEFKANAREGQGKGKSDQDQKVGAAQKLFVPSLVDAELSRSLSPAYSSSLSDTLDIKTALGGASKGAAPNKDVQVWAADIVGVESDQTRLSAAVAASKLGLNEQLQKALIQCKAIVRARDNEGRSCLHYSAGYGHEECVNTLLEKGADPLSCDANGDVPLHFASIHGHPMCVYNISKVCASACIIKNKRGQTPVDVAASCERGEVLNAMLLACAGDGSAVAVLTMRKLLAKGAVPDTWAPNGSSALMLAASANAAKSLKVLLGAGASIELQDALGRSALMFAAGNCAQDTLVALLDAGACMAQRDRRGRSVSEYAPDNSEVAATLKGRLCALEEIALRRQADLLALLDASPAPAPKSSKSSKKKKKGAKAAAATTHTAAPAPATAEKAASKEAKLNQDSAAAPTSAMTEKAASKEATLNQDSAAAPTSAMTEKAGSTVASKHATHNQVGDSVEVGHVGGGPLTQPLESTDLLVILMLHILDGSRTGLEAWVRVTVALATFLSASQAAAKTTQDALVGVKAAVANSPTSSPSPSVQAAQEQEDQEAAKATQDAPVGVKAATNSATSSPSPFVQAAQEQEDQEAAKATQDAPVGVKAAVANSATSSPSAFIHPGEEKGDQVATKVSPDTMDCAGAPQETLQLAGEASQDAAKAIQGVTMGVKAATSSPWVSLPHPAPQSALPSAGEALHDAMIGARSPQATLLSDEQPAVGKCDRDEQPAVGKCNRDEQPAVGKCDRDEEHSSGNEWQVVGAKSHHKQYLPASQPHPNPQHHEQQHRLHPHARLAVAHHKTQHQNHNIQYQYQNTEHQHHSQPSTCRATPSQRSSVSIDSTQALPASAAGAASTATAGGRHQEAVRVPMKPKGGCPWATCRATPSQCSSVSGDSAYALPASVSSVAGAASTATAAGGRHQEAAGVPMKPKAGCPWATCRATPSQCSSVSGDSAYALPASVSSVAGAASTATAAGGRHLEAAGVPMKPKAGLPWATCSSTPSQRSSVSGDSAYALPALFSSVAGAASTATAAGGRHQEAAGVPLKPKGGCPWATCRSTPSQCSSVSVSGDSAYALPASVSAAATAAGGRQQEAVGVLIRPKGGCPWAPMPHPSPQSTLLSAEKESQYAAKATQDAPVGVRAATGSNTSSSSPFVQPAQVKEDQAAAKATQDALVGVRAATHSCTSSPFPFIQPAQVKEAKAGIPVVSAWKLDIGQKLYRAASEEQHPTRSSSLEALSMAAISAPHTSTALQLRHPSQAKSSTNPWSRRISISNNGGGRTSMDVLNTHHFPPLQPLPTPTLSSNGMSPCSSFSSLLPGSHMHERTPSTCSSTDLDLGSISTALTWLSSSMGSSTTGGVKAMDGHPHTGWGLCPPKLCPSVWSPEVAPWDPLGLNAEPYAVAHTERCGGVQTGQAGGVPCGGVQTEKASAQTKESVKQAKNVIVQTEKSIDLSADAYADFSLRHVDGGMSEECGKYIFTHAQEWGKNNEKSTTPGSPTASQSISSPPKRISTSLAATPGSPTPSQYTSAPLMRISTSLAATPGSPNPSQYTSAPLMRISTSLAATPGSPTLSQSTSAPPMRISASLAAEMARLRVENEALSRSLKEAEAREAMHTAQMALLVKQAVESKMLEVAGAVHQERLDFVSQLLAIGWAPAYIKANILAPLAGQDRSECDASTSTTVKEQAGQHSTRKLQQAQGGQHQGVHGGQGGQQQVGQAQAQQARGKGKAGAGSAQRTAAAVAKQYSSEHAAKQYSSEHAAKQYSSEHVAKQYSSNRPHVVSAQARNPLEQVASQARHPLDQVLEDITAEVEVPTEEGCAAMSEMKPRVTPFVAPGHSWESPTLADPIGGAPTPTQGRWENSSLPKPIGNAEVEGRKLSLDTDGCSVGQVQLQGNCGGGTRSAHAKRALLMNDASTTHETEMFADDSLLHGFMGSAAMSERKSDDSLPACSDRSRSAHAYRALLIDDTSTTHEVADAHCTHYAPPGSPCTHCIPELFTDDSLPACGDISLSLAMSDDDEDDLCQSLYSYPPQGGVRSTIRQSVPVSIPWIPSVPPSCVHSPQLGMSTAPLVCPPRVSTAHSWAGPQPPSCVHSPQLWADASGGSVDTGFMSLAGKQLLYTAVNDTHSSYPSDCDPSGRSLQPSEGSFRLHPQLGSFPFGGLSAPPQSTFVTHTGFAELSTTSHVGAGEGPTSSPAPTHAGGNPITQTNARGGNSAAATSSASMLSTQAGWEFAAMAHLTSIKLAKSPTQAPTSRCFESCADERAYIRNKTAQVLPPAMSPSALSHQYRLDIFSSGGIMRGASQHHEGALVCDHEGGLAAP